MGWEFLWGYEYLWMWPSNRTNEEKWSCSTGQILCGTFPSRECHISWGILSVHAVKCTHATEDKLPDFTNDLHHVHNRNVNITKEKSITLLNIQQLLKSASSLFQMYQMCWYLSSRIWTDRSTMMVHWLHYLHIMVWQVKAYQCGNYMGSQIM